MRQQKIDGDHREQSTSRLTYLLTVTGDSAASRGAIRDDGVPYEDSNSRARPRGGHSASRKPAEQDGMLLKQGAAPAKHSATTTKSLGHCSFVEQWQPTNTEPRGARRLPGCVLRSGVRTYIERAILIGDCAEGLDGLRGRGCRAIGDSQIDNERRSAVGGCWWRPRAKYIGLVAAVRDATPLRLRRESVGTETYW